MNYLDNLNNQQKEAVLHLDGPCLVMAGAGSGKTRVLTHRIVNLINNGVYSNNILAITFTNKAANEMKERINKLIPDNRCFIGTFHAIGLRILKENLSYLNLGNHLTILDSDDVLTVIKKIMKENNIDTKSYAPSYIRNRISFIKNEMLNDSEINRFFNTDAEKVAVKIYYEYENLIHKNGSVDFDDLLTMPVKLFQNNKTILQYYQDKFEYILIDEYQDTNEVQYKFAKLLASKHHNIFVVGDVDQSIYGFRQANYKNILNFEKDYQDAKVILLEENYRSTQNILNVANSIIKNNKERKEKKLWSSIDNQNKVVYFRSYDERHEITLVVEKIKQLLAKGYRENEMAILYRTNAQSRIVEEMLLKYSLPYKVVGSYYFYARKEIKDLISYLRLIQNPNDDISLRRVINVPKRKIGPKAVENLENMAKLANSSMFEAIDSGKELEFKKIILNLQESYKDLSLSELIDKVLENTGIVSEYKNEKSLEADIKIENLMEFKSIAAFFEKNTGSVSLDDFLEEITLVSDMALHQEKDDCITLMTIHSAKGLEFKIVFLIGMEEGIFPHINSIMENNIEEERRLCYVGITRACEYLFLSNAKRRMLFGKESINPPSRFINEIDENLLDIESNIKEEKKIDKNDFYNNDEVTEQINKGDLIHHEMYGNGVVIEMNGSLITVAFKNNVGIKKLFKNHKSIKKI